MGIQLPKLDDRAYADLVGEARSLIPTVAAEWTDHNPTDPGITLLELVAWLVEGLIYRSDQITPQARLTFVRLLVGPDVSLTPPAGLDDAGLRAFVDDQARAALRAVRARYRAVTVEDYEALSLEASPDVARVRCIPRRFVEADVSADRPGELSVIVLPRAGADETATRALVGDYLDPRRILTTKVHVVAPSYAPVRVEVSIATRADVTPWAAARGVADAVDAFLHPLTGGPGGDGWPFGGAVYVSDLVALLEGLDLVDYVPAAGLTSVVQGGETAHRAADEEWNQAGDLVALTLAPDQLADLRPFPDPGPGPGIVQPARSEFESRIFASDRFASVTVSIGATLAAGADAPTALRTLKQAVAGYFHPDFGGPTGQAPWQPDDATVTLHTALVAAAAESATITSLAVAVDPPHLDDAGVPRVWLAEGELADVTTEVALG